MFEKFMKKIIKKQEDKTTEETIPITTINMGANLTGNIGLTAGATTATTYTSPYPFNLSTVYYPNISFPAPPSYIYKLQDKSGKDVITVTDDGKIIWNNADETSIQEAAESFSYHLNLSIEKRAGILETTKKKMRDSIFNDLINIAKEKGTLNADDLTYLLEASKMLEKLKGDQ